MGLLAGREGPEHVLPLTEPCAPGEVAIHVDRVVGLDEVPAALAAVGEGRPLGKVVVQVARRPGGAQATWRLARVTTRPSSSIAHSSTSSPTRAANRFRAASAGGGAPSARSTAARNSSTPGWVP